MVCGNEPSQKDPTLLENKKTSIYGEKKITKNRTSCTKRN
ncbi:MAG: hypothetical protein Pg6B_01620 [Candidatus Azobacteroides pseudotrichonymphae]|jgi:hypothetical protein|nr:MAG: hypothetical protein Pg6B_01620 [Candidatus Azobacteroides pseudotrichonymphae]